MAFKLTKPPFEPIISQRQIDLEESWWKERFRAFFYFTPESYWSVATFKTTLDGQWWWHFQICIWRLTIEGTARLTPTHPAHSE